MVNKEYYLIHEARYKYIAAKTEKMTKGKVLDVGCYPGHMGEIWEKQGWEVWGICSPFEKMESNRVKAVNVEKEKWPFESESMDLIVMTEIIEHLTDDSKKYLGEAFRVLKRGGKILITTPNIVRWQNVIKMILGKNIYFPIKQLAEEIYYRHNREFTMDELEMILKESGFAIFEKDFFIGYPPYRQRNKEDSLGLKIIKWTNYLLSLVTPNRRDNLFIVGEKKLF